MPCLVEKKQQKNKEKRKNKIKIKARRKKPGTILKSAKNIRTLLTGQKQFM
jgi:hypothetical protein